jgi:hypothetical protein
MSRRLVMQLAALIALGALSIGVPKLALLAVGATLISALSLPALEGKARGTTWALIGLSALLCFVGFMRFLLDEAVPGIVYGGRAAASESALWRLRELVHAEDGLRVHPKVDPDGDGIGSAALVGELAGVIPLRGERRLDPPALNGRYARLMETPLGPAAVIGTYLLLVCLPAQGGGYTARPAERVDEEAAERRYVAYTWPMAGGEGALKAYFIDEHERILVTDNTESDGAPRWLGPSFPPPCDAALAAATRGAWRTWRGKIPHRDLPGDHG